MFERFTERSRQIAVLAREEAHRLRHNYIGTEHLLHGIAAEEKGAAARSLAVHGMTPENVHAAVVRLVDQGEKATTGQIPFTPGAKKALEYSLREALGLAVNYVGTEHVLLGLLRLVANGEDDGAATRVLTDLGTDPGEIRKTVLGLVEREARVPPFRQPSRSAPAQREPGGRGREADVAGAPSSTGQASTKPEGRSGGQESTPIAPSGLEAVPTHADRPAIEDELGRARLAEVLAERIRRVRGEDTERPVGGRREARRKLRADRRAARGAGSFMVHVHAPWGAGKSSLLNFLAVDLRNLPRRPSREWWGDLLDSAFGRRRPANAGLSQWVVVEFNAWEHQRLAPPWWWLLAAIRRSCARELWRIGRGRWAWFWIRDIGWRLWNSRVAWLTVLLLVGLTVIAKAFNWFGLEHSSLKVLKASAVSVSVLLAAGTAIWGRIHGTSRWLALGSAEGAAKFLRRAHDPLGVYRRRFRWLVRSAGRPIAVFVDDLDRCKPEYVVDLLEGIQTLFAGESVAYVVAADRTWLCESFATTYAAFKEVVGDCGRPLGFLFLEKTFQVSMEIPPMSVENRRRYWRSLTGAFGEADVDVSRRRAELTGAFEQVTTHAQVDSRIRSLIEGGADEEDVLRAAVRKLNAPSLQAQLEDLLREFAALLENNPRSMKRLVNAYGIERDRLLLDGRLPSTDERRQLVLYTILRLRWPLFSDHLLKHPEDVEHFNGTSPREDHPYAQLFSDREARALFDGSRVDVKLDAQILAHYAGGDPAGDPDLGVDSAQPLSVGA